MPCLFTCWAIAPSFHCFCKDSEIEAGLLRHSFMDRSGGDNVHYKKLCPNPILHNNSKWTLVGFIVYLHWSHHSVEMEEKLEKLEKR